MNDIRQISLNVAPNGRVVIPASMREELGCEKGGKLIARMENGVLILEPFQVTLRRLQAFVRTYIPDPTGIIDAFIAERHAEAERE
jgi:AbrB family looped-hinge helix DNA binding protein